ncbi:hypothetical protein HMPREF1624_07325 [Sporothrix schenckii ATCC 58251]|uniref:Myb-like domain-containing protein n=1 Tax=Sporothrix schenckii (strain ATCC 58251 / de Perez 2211183) TaxID=1391915 RepID=U7PPL7_SPOS1|nr:hypothetical protein HMPREF1624_07325 [Sporothrix schenckii ATCC 58251]
MSDRSRPEDDEDDDGLLQHQLAETVEFVDTQQWPLREDDLVGSRRELESESSDYRPSDSEPSPEPAVSGVKEEEDGSVRLGDVEAHDGSSESESESEDEDDDEDENENEDEGSASAFRAGQKRTRERTFSTPLVDDSEPQNKKLNRAKSSVNLLYTEILEDDMDDARRKYVAEDRTKLSTTQIGLTVWTAEEKEIFFESLARLGSDDIPGIAARLLGSKSEIEVRHYKHVLDENVQARKRDPRAPFHRPLLSDIPVATEIGKACCDALQKTADAVARREFQQDAKAEQRKWGPQWLLTGDNCRALSKAALEMAGMPGDDEASNQSPMPIGGPQGERLAELGAQMHPNSVPMLTLFDVRTMLLLSERVFMNGTEEDANYMGLGDALPAMHMSALHDLYALVYALTQRLAATAMHFCRSRDQAKRHLPRSVKKLVRPRDVRAAVASLGLKKDSQVFWARCPRRLGLNVRRTAIPFADMQSSGIRTAAAAGSAPDVSENNAEGSSDDKEGSQDSSSDDDSDIISTYGEVEKELLPDGADQKPSSLGIDEDEGSLGEEDGLSDIDDYSDTDESNEYSSNDTDENQERDTNAATTEQRVTTEANEIIHHTANGYPTAAWAETSLRNRIRDELKEEEYASAVDEHASRRDELYLWAVLGQRPPTETGLDQFNENVPPHVEGFSADARRYPVDEIIATGSDWRDKLQYEAEWEGAAVQAQKIAKEEVRQANEL